MKNEKEMVGPSFPTPESASAFWAALDPQSRVMLAKTAPRVAGRWRMLRDRSWMFGTDQWRRGGVAEVGSFNMGGPVFFYSIGGLRADHHLTFDSLTAAKSACDAKLRELGYLLEDE
jgi:hypothetical protein